MAPNLFLSQIEGYTLLQPWGLSVQLNDYFANAIHPICSLQSCKQIQNHILILYLKSGPTFGFMLTLVLVFDFH